MSDPATPTPPPAPRPVVRDEKGRLAKGSGRPENAGRKVGSPYRKLTWDVKALCEAAGFNPFEAMIDLAENAKSEKIQYQARAELCKYVAPQLKSVEIKDTTASQVVFSWADSFEDIPTFNADGTPAVTHMPGDTMPGPGLGTVAHEVEALLNPGPDDAD